LLKKSKRRPELNLNSKLSIIFLLAVVGFKYSSNIDGINTIIDEHLPLFLSHRYALTSLPLIIQSLYGMNISPIILLII
jgi:hypothetical protein